MSSFASSGSPSFSQSAKLAVQQGHFQQAITLAEKGIMENETDLESRYCLAVCQRKLQQYSQALDSLSVLINMSPEYDRAYQEKGYNFLAMGKKNEAIDAFDTAVKYNPSLLASWKVLSEETTYHRQKEAKVYYAWLSSLPRELVTVASYIHQKKLHKAEQLCRSFLKKNPRNVEAMRMLAELGVEFQILDDAEFLLESALSFSPNFTRARFDFINVLHRRQKFHQALEQAQTLFDADSNNPLFIVGLANAQQSCGEFELAVETYDQALAIEQNNSSILVSKGHALKTIGKVPEAIVSYQQAYQQRADYGDAFWSLANLKTYRFSDNEINHMMEQVERDSTSAEDKAHFCFALGKGFEDRKEYARSFEFYASGNTLKKAKSRYDLSKVTYELDYQKQHFDSAFFDKFKNAGCASQAPIFIVGLPRAGSTLIEQILASHSQVDGTMELANIISMAHHLNGRRVNSETPRYPSILQDMSFEQCLNLGQKYIDETMAHRNGAPFFIDKMPNNFRHIPFIQLILPNAKIIDARREPMACCFSGFKQLFAEGQDFSYDLSDMGNYYRHYVDVMDHWDNVLPNRILRVQHEDLHENLEQQVRRILDYCELPFEQNCVEFHQSTRPVRTPSSEQVRLPLYKDAVHQWEHYDGFLEPLKHALNES
ncbi:sulfotransferase [Alteromonas sp. 5E99-2]|uniref:tetratricopeptide repeat-containing sulfotransferase family protein n=1 Tax=Alteromonas sp. 5E99-2 TaxID=2817683 RepID=UPI001A997610|nr:tetratricopeptide repeat-containing sulfotransferase family protein [Alteromonas sp. 5E99-2]MBO1255326.1 sulfotransferase [Alteromonas sp. 5E99-2]